MNYNAITIGERIKTARCKPFNESSGYSQGGLAVALGLDSTSRTTIRKWERGEVLPPLEHLLKMCELFGCELGYLLGEYDLPTRTATDIQQETGLSVKAIEQLQRHKAMADGRLDTAPAINAEFSTVFLKSLSMLLTHQNFFHFICDMYKYGNLYNSSSTAILEKGDDTSIGVWEIAGQLEKQGWSLLSNVQAANYWLYSSLDTLRGIAQDIWEDCEKLGNE